MHKQILKAAILAANTRFVTVTFIKQDGTVRKVNGRFNALSRTVSGKGIDLAKRLEQNNPLIPFWNPKEGWKSFRLDRVLSVSVSNTKVAAN